MENDINIVSDDKKPSETKIQKIFRYLKNIIVTILVLIIPSLWLLKENEIKQIEEENIKSVESIKLSAENALVKEKIVGLTVLSKAYVWAIRKEMINENIQQVNLYANDMVKEQNFKSIMVCNTNGYIISSSDKRLEGKLFTEIGDANQLKNNVTKVLIQKDSTFQVFSPIMGFNSRLGTLIINYKNSPINL